MKQKNIIILVAVLAAVVFLMVFAFARMEVKNIADCTLVDVSEVELLEAEVSASGFQPAELEAQQCDTLFIYNYSDEDVYVDFEGGAYDDNNGASVLITPGDFSELLLDQFGTVEVGLQDSDSTLTVEVEKDEELIQYSTSPYTDPDNLP